MATNKLFLIQDSDRPMHVVAPSWQHALERWRDLIRSENVEDPLDEPVEPDGIALIATESTTFTELLL